MKEEEIPGDWDEEIDTQDVQTPRREPVGGSTVGPPVTSNFGTRCHLKSRLRGEVKDHGEEEVGEEPLPLQMPLCLCSHQKTSPQ